MLPFFRKAGIAAALLFSLLTHRATGFVPLVPAGVASPPSTFGTTSPFSHRSNTELYGVRSFVRRIFRRKSKDDKSNEGVTGLETTTDESIDEEEVKIQSEEEEVKIQFEEIGLVKQKETERASVCIIGGGVSGMAAGITCAKGLAKNKNAKVVLLEASSDVGGRVRSDKTEDGFTLDRGFAVFIEEYPESRKLVDYDELKLGKFLPGALVKLSGLNKLARVADPLREPGELINALVAPIGDLVDKFGILMLALHVKSKSIQELFEEEETSTKDALDKRWRFGEEIQVRFFKPFLEGIYLAPVEEQSSRMFSFVFKMFSDGAASLPQGGIGAVSQQLAEKAKSTGVDIRLNTPVEMLLEDKEENKYTVVAKGGKDRILADCVIVATDGVVANDLISQINGFESLGTLTSQVQRSVGNLYYSFKGEPPVTDPILILNGMKGRGDAENPVNNVCFPSVVTKGYAPEGFSLCSVTVLKDAMDLYEGRDEELDAAVRKQLGKWFPDFKSDILNTWELKRIYRIPKAQPGQFKGPFPANVHGARASNTYRNKQLPDGLYVCGDHMSTATLNGALESGLLAGAAAFKRIPKS